MSAEHRFVASVAWRGTTASGYDAFVRAHDVRAGGHTWRGSAAAAFNGDDALTNPEQLLVAAAAQCQMLSFLAVAARARLTVVEYRDEATGVMPEGERPMWVRRIELKPHVRVEAGVSPEKLRRLTDVAHGECFIAASLRSDVVVSPTFEIIPAGHGRSKGAAGGERM